MKSVKIVKTEKSEKVDQMIKYVPKGQSPRIYIELINQQILGTDKQGNPRSEKDLMYFLYVCKRTGLDPLAKQIYAVYRWDYRLGAEKMVIQVGIDGFRLIAQRSREYAGQDDTLFTPEDESAQYPTKATSTVFKLNRITGERMPIVASARWKEYAQYNKRDGKETLSDMWNRMPYNQLGKCAEALALRKAFPNDLSGLYIPEEITEQPAKGITSDLPTPKGKAKKEKVIKEIVKHEIVEEPLKVEPVQKDVTDIRKELKEKAERKTE